MAKAHPCVDQEGGPTTAWMIQCPACGNGHKFDVNRWQFNGDVDRPTFTPSMLVGGAGVPEYGRCHSFVRDGRIEFLSDCTHELAGKTVDLEDW